VSKRVAQACVKTPDRPKSRMTARPITKAGVMIGSTVNALSVRRKRKPVRVATSAKARPMSVEMIPTRTARKIEFPATPQRLPSVRQRRLQRRSLKSFSTKVKGEMVPSSVNRAFVSICMIGIMTKSDTTAMTKPIAPTTKTLPPMAPRAAMPRVKRKRKAAAVSRAP